MPVVANRVRMEAHNGLRGVLACWVMVFHCFIYSEYPVDLQGSSLMPFFFLLSGFSLTVVYGEKTEVDGKFLDKSAFYQNRFARCFPVYYICTFAAIPLWAYGFGGVDPLRNLAAVIASIVVSVIPVCTFFIFLLGGPIDGPGWTICTLAVMWWLFPYSYPGIRARTNAQLLADIASFYWLQLALVFIIFPPLLILLGFWPAFCAATMQPLVRYPVFLMGAFAGELCRRCPEEPILWPSAALRFFPACCCCKVGHDRALESEATAHEHWRQQSWNSSIVFLLASFSVALVDALIRYGSGGDGDNGTILGGWWYQALVPFIQLDIIVSLTRETETNSQVQKVLMSPIAQWLGKLSMNIYLIHWVLIYYLCWAIHGSRLKWPEDYDCEDGPDHDECVAEIEDFNDARKLPVWGILVVILASLLAAEVLHRLVEVPGRKLLKASSSEFTVSNDDRGSTFSPVTTHLPEDVPVPIFN